MKPIFITGNQDKADYLAKMLGISLEHVKVDLDEIQSLDLDAIVEHKVRQAYDVVRKPVLVEDVALGFTAIGGLPGPFVKFFVDAPDGLENMCRILDGFSDRTARASCTFGYFDGETVTLFRGGLDGEIANAPRGENGYGWDKIFSPEGYGGKTRAELTPSDDVTSYATIKPFAALRKFLTTL
ncbi:MAG TPA: non-canonical purine NTP pyrophosphatase [Candidatus Saccharimonadales bacterium]|jgi:inosine triphosphate pyrophosphatase|nr:non-canonical purine NTP pyrophosphatase [Candidatus Saccharimonadales bacterium]